MNILIVYLIFISVLEIVIINSCFGLVNKFVNIFLKKKEKIIMLNYYIFYNLKN